MKKILNTLLVLLLITVLLTSYTKTNYYKLQAKDPIDSTAVFIASAIVPFEAEIPYSVGDTVWVTLKHDNQSVIDMKDSTALKAVILKEL